MTPNPLCSQRQSPKPDSPAPRPARVCPQWRGARVTLHHVGSSPSRRIFTMAMTRCSPCEPDLRSVQQSPTQAHHLVIVAPVWWGHLPAGSRGCWIAPCCRVRLSLPAGEGVPGAVARRQDGTPAAHHGQPLVLLRWWQEPLIAPWTSRCWGRRHPADPPPASGARPHLRMRGPPALASS